MAFDDHADHVRDFAEGITYPVLLDREHLLSETYAVSNVPTVLWIDENDRIVRPNGVAFGVDMFVEFTGIPAEPHMQAVRDWVRTGVVDIPAEQAAGAVEDLSDDEVAARLEFRIAAHLRRIGDEDGAALHFARAGELAPYDFSVRRAAMPLQGEDPFGEKFMTLYEEWQAAGSPYHGLPRPPRPQ